MNQIFIFKCSLTFYLKTFKSNKKIAFESQIFVKISIQTANMGNIITYNYFLFLVSYISIISYILFIYLFLTPNNYYHFKNYYSLNLLIFPLIYK